MGKAPSIPVERILPKTGPDTLTVPEARAILAIAFLASQADHEVDVEEEGALQALTKGIRTLAPKSDELGDDAIEKLFEKLAEERDDEEPADCLARVVAPLERQFPRELAYKVAVAMSVVDLASNDDETDFEGDLLDALQLTDEQADLLSGDVYAAIDGD